MIAKDDTIKLSFPIYLVDKRIDDPLYKLDELKSKIESFNKDSQLDGLDPNCNPELLDIDKVIAFLKWLNINKNDLEKNIANGEIYIHNPYLPLSYSHPVNSDQIIEGQIIEISEDELTYKPMIKVEFNVEKARDLESLSKVSFFKFHAKVLEAEKNLTALEDRAEKRALMDKLMFIRHGRYRSLLSWEINARILSDNGENQDLEMIEEFKQDFEVPPLNNF